VTQNYRVVRDIQDMLSAFKEHASEQPQSHPKQSLIFHERHDYPSQFLSKFVPQCGTPNIADSAAAQALSINTLPEL
jgi:hypothetical protein